MGRIDSGNLEQVPALYVRYSGSYQPTSSSMQSSSSGFWGGNSDAAAAAAAAAAAQGGNLQPSNAGTQQEVQQVKGTVEKTCGRPFHLLAQSSYP